MVARINISSGSVFSILFDNTEKDLNTLIKRLQWRCKQTHQSPLSLPAILFETYGYTSEECRRKLDAEVVSLEVRTGMTALDTTTNVNQDGKMNYSLRISDYEKMMRDLHSCNTNLIFLGNVLSFEMEFGMFCGRLFDVFEDLRGRISNNNKKEEEKGKYHSPRAKDEFHQHLAYFLDSSRCRLKQTQSLRMRVESQINVVCFLSCFLFFSSLLSQIYIHIQSNRGGRGQLLKSERCQMYSLISQRDMRNNIIIAKDSQEIAEAAQQDSRTMKTIALMTLIFLPGTLVAVSSPSSPSPASSFPKFPFLSFVSGMPSQNHNPYIFIHLQLNIDLYLNVHKTEHLQHRHLRSQPRPRPNKQQ